jgi:hypothetical protein
MQRERMNKVQSRSATRTLQNVYYVDKKQGPHSFSIQRGHRHDAFGFWNPIRLCGRRRDSGRSTRHDRSQADLRRSYNVRTFHLSFHLSSLQFFVCCGSVSLMTQTIQKQQGCKTFAVSSPSDPSHLPNGRKRETGAEMGINFSLAKS